MNFLYPYGYNVFQIIIFNTGEHFLTLYVLLVFLSVAIFLFFYFFIYGNFHKADDNLYRSGRLYPFNLLRYVKMFQIKSILNLQSTRRFKHTYWYKNEMSVANQLGIDVYEYPIGDREMISVESMTEIINIIKNAPKPMLIHCKRGADRTSFAVALYQYAINNDIDKAYRSLSIIYGHFPWFGSKTVAMDKSLDLYIEHTQKLLDR